jgi:hypothetical protein
MFSSNMISISFSLVLRLFLGKGQSLFTPFASSKRERNHPFSNSSRLLLASAANVSSRFAAVRQFALCSRSSVRALQPFVSSRFAAVRQFALHSQHQPAPASTSWCWRLFYPTQTLVWAGSLFSPSQSRAAARASLSFLA